MSAAASETPLDFTEEELNVLLNNLDACTPEEIAEIDRMVDELATRKANDASYNDLIAFCKRMQPDYIVGSHHRILANMLMAIERGDKDRICVNIPPRHGKSQLVSTYFPAWFLGRNPNKKVMMVSHTTDLAVDFGRKVRNLILSDEYAEIFPTVRIATDSKSAGRWNTNGGGEYYACGIGSSIAGRGADLLLIDDPHSEQDVLNGNFEVFEKAYEWFTFGARTRLMPGGRVAIIQCMTGDTPVLRPDGSETLLRDIRPGDMVASYKDGKLVSRRVVNWASQGVDHTFTVKLTSGITLQANARHPFLVDRRGYTEWTRLKDLRPGDTLVSLKGAQTPEEQKLNRVFAGAAHHGSHTTEKTLEQNAAHWGTMVSTLVEFARNLGVTVRHGVRGVVIHAIQSIATTLSGKRGMGPTITPGYGKILTSSGFTVSALPIMNVCWPNKGAGALFVGSFQAATTPRSLGVGAYALTTAIPGGESGLFCAITATSSLKATSQKICSIEPFSTSEIISIEYAGREEVFDIQVEETENFIANSIVSHNTRWHQDDLTGRVTRDMAQNNMADQYEVVEFPAILTVEDKATGKPKEKPLWPQFFDLKALHRTKASMPVFQWNAQYQQKPTAEEASIIKREWWQTWTKEDPPPCEYIIMSLDAAAETHNRADYTALTTWGVFFNEETNETSIILLNSIKDRYEFPELKRLCLEEYEEWEPDSFIVEKKSAGTAIYQEMRRMGIPVQEYTPHRGSGDKLARLNSVSDIVASGLVWVPQTRWAEELVEEVAGFPFMSHDDLVDSMVMALMRFRSGGFIRLPSDERDEPTPFKYRRGGYY